jgi:hypothetical protein
MFDLSTCGLLVYVSQNSQLCSQQIITLMLSKVITLVHSTSHHIYALKTSHHITDMLSTSQHRVKCEGSHEHNHTHTSIPNLLGQKLLLCSRPGQKEESHKVKYKESRQQTTHRTPCHSLSLARPVLNLFVCVCVCVCVFVS